MTSQTPSAAGGGGKSDVSSPAGNRSQDGRELPLGTKRSYDLCLDKTGFKRVFPQRKSEIASLLKRGVRVRLVTELTNEVAVAIGDLGMIQLRYLDSVNANFAVSDQERIELFEFQDESKPEIRPRLTVLDSPLLVAQQQRLFELIWEKAGTISSSLSQSPSSASLADRINLAENPNEEQEKTEILSGEDIIVKTTLEKMKLIKQTFDNCTDSTGPSVFLAAPPVWEQLLSMKKRGVRLRFITDIKLENIRQCKTLMEVVELRHLESIKGNFGIADGMEYGGSNSVTEGRPPSKLVFSTAKVFVAQQQYLFETLWEKAIPAEQKIGEIESGHPPQSTEVSYGPENVIRRSLQFLDNAEHTVDLCGDADWSATIVSAPPVHQRYVALANSGVRIRCISEITKENLQYAKQMREFCELRHLDGLKGYFAICDSRLFASITTNKDGAVLSQIIVSSVKGLVEQQQYFFNALWEKAEQVEQKMSEIEKGQEPERLELLSDSEKSIELAYEVMMRTQKEFLVLFATSQTFMLAMTMDPSVIYRAITDKGARVRILVPRGDGIDRAVKEVLKIAPAVQVRITDANLNTHITLMVADRKEFMSWELKDDTVSDPLHAAGVATYSNTISLAESYATIFENLWRTAEFAENLRMANLRLEQNDKAMREFIDITAHELRNPIQPILGLSEILQERQSSPEQKELLGVIVRNARRLEQLAEDVLDVTRIESGRLRLAIEKVELTGLVTAVVQDFQKSLAPDHHNNNGEDDADGGRNTGGYGDGTKSLELCGLYEDKKGKGHCLNVQVDPSRIAQVLANLLSNAIKFTTKGKVTVSIGRTINTDRISEAVISVADTGPGIDPDIMPRLFEKFVSSSEKGIGLGLYLSKKIIDAHAGRIWAENNENEIGATFYVALPLRDS